MAFWFDTNGANFGFRAGQHADFVFKHPRMEGVSDNSRTLSLASSPHDKGPVMIAMRMRKTPFKTALKSAALGDKEEHDLVQAVYSSWTNLLNVEVPPVDSFSPDRN
jgi:ferredoxin-NADP reductase